MRTALALCTLAACSFQPGAAAGGGDANGGGDDTVDAPRPTDGSDGSGSDAQDLVCVGHVRQVCQTGTPADYTVDKNDTDNIDTDNDGRCIVIHQAPGHDLCAIYGNTVTIHGTVRGHGSRPLVIASVGDFLVDNAGIVDVGTYTNFSTGAGANGPGCGGATTKSKGNGNGGGGGAGGSFQFAGGAGGAGANGAAAGGTAASTVLAVNLHVVRGGCAGEAGGSTLLDETAGNAADSGGAVLLVSGGKLTVAGKVLAGGGGGNLALARFGGGGGGAGGFIGFDAVGALSLTGAVVANGGGGGGGGGAMSTGNFGGDAKPDAGAAPKGDGGGTTGGDGAVGSTGMTGADGVAAQAGGGAGGGGAGFIFNFGSPHSGGAVITPDIIVQPSL